jgi:hypothetical protein
MVPRGIPDFGEPCCAGYHKAKIKYYNMLVFDPKMDDAIESVLTQLRKVRDYKSLNSDEYLELLTKFVQSIPIDRTVPAHTPSNPIGGFPRMPIQVLMNYRGNAEDRVLLLAALLSREGYGTAIIHFPLMPHKMLGVLAEGEGFRGSGFELIETTNFLYISEVPGSESGIVSTSTNPDLLIARQAERKVIIPLKSTRNGLHYSAPAVAEVEHIIAVRKRGQIASEELFDYIEATPMTDERFNKYLAKWKNSVARRGPLLSCNIEGCIIMQCCLLENTLDDAGNFNQFKDRRKALEWIDQYAWWE